MGNMMDYLAWRGDLTIAQSPFNEVDNLILSELAYLDFTGIVAEDAVPLCVAAEAFFAQERDKAVERTALFMAHDLGPLLRAVAYSPRFAETGVCHFTRRVDFEQETQFQAVTFDLGRSGLYVAYCGTDDTLVGWKEDFNMSFLDAVPAQIEAKAYFDRVAASHPRRPLLLGGHSKGGNLAVYSAVHASARLQKRIDAVYSNDGPGFRDDLVRSEAYAALRDRIVTFIPQSSVIGLLMEHDEEFVVVKSCQKGILQHDGFSWEVERGAFVHLREKSAEMLLVDRTLKKIIGGLSIAQRARFTDAIFEILESGGNRTTTDLRSEGLKALTGMKRAYDGLDEETRRAVNDTVTLLLSESIRTCWEAAEVPVAEWRENLEQVWARLRELPRQVRRRQEAEN